LQKGERDFSSSSSDSRFVYFLWTLNAVRGLDRVYAELFLRIYVYTKEKRTPTPPGEVRPPDKQGQESITDH
jgi:hypothetical protein